MRNYVTYFVEVIAAEGEHKASRALRDASEIIAESPSALQLRYLQVQAL
jgi:erythrocyte band 7 integral membrane protein